jgi:hypothetical protein
MGRLRPVVGIAFAAFVAAGCASAPVRMTAAKTVAAAASADDDEKHLVPTGEGTFYCKLTDEVVGAAKVKEHLDHLRAAAATTGHAGGSHAKAGPHGGPVADDPHADHGEVRHTGHGAARVGIAGEPHDHSAMYDCHPTADEQAAADQLVADTKASLAKYARVERAMVDTYQPFGGPDDHRSQHYVNDAYRRDPAVLDTDHVESLVYGWTERHGLVLIGAMYMMPRAGMSGPEIGGCLTQWHIHEAGHGDFGEAGELPEMLHVWTVDMPGGPFAQEPNAEYIKNL